MNVIWKHMYYNNQMFLVFKYISNNFLTINSVYSGIITSYVKLNEINKGISFISISFIKASAYLKLYEMIKVINFINDDSKMP